MTRRSLSLFSIAVACAAMVSISISSCDSNNTPTTPGNNGGANRGKGPQVLDDGSKSTVAITDIPFGGASLSYNSEADLVVSGLNGSTGSGVNCTFAEPVNVWRAATDISFPATGGSLTYASKDALGNTEATVNLRSEGSGYIAYPTFTSAPGGGTPLYDVYVYDNGAQVGFQTSVAAASTIRLIPSGTCQLKLKAVRWDVYQVNSQCLWKLWFHPCCKFQFVLPNGTIVNGNEIKFVERNSNGVYVYLKTKTITTTGNVASYAIASAAAFSTE